LNYLKSHNEVLRLKHQLKGFVETLPLDLAISLCQISFFDLKIYENFFENLFSLKIDKNLRLGNRVEYLFEYALRKMPNIEVVVKSIQIVENKITLGELDFIVFDKLKNEFTHIEIANKFYLYDEKITVEKQRWIGPNRTDSLVEKCEKLRTKQFPLIDNKTTKSQLVALGIDVFRIKQAIHFKAQLFVPLHLQNKVFPLVNAENIKGYYLNLKQFQQAEFKHYEYFIPEKQDWFTEPENGEIWFTFQEIQDSILLHFKEEKSPLIWVKKNENEFEKVFLVWW